MTPADGARRLADDPVNPTEPDAEPDELDKLAAILGVSRLEASRRYTEAWIAALHEKATAVSEREAA